MLYIALIMLILLALIGVIGMQVAGMQERMSANYQAVNIAFQNVEGVIRESECGIEAFENRDAVAAAECDFLDPAEINTRCDDGFDARVWAEAQSFAAVPAVNVRQITQCVQGEAPLDQGGPINENTPTPIYQITGYAADKLVDPTSSAVVDTIFKL